MSLRLDGPGETYVQVVADSISAHTGDRVTSFEVNTHRFCLAEWNTHALFNRNSASSRAIPAEKQLARYEDIPALPVEWASEQPGMQGGPDLDGEDLEAAQSLFQGVHDYTALLVRRYLTDHPPKTLRLHKSLLNRLLEPFQYHLMLITASSYENFFDQRVSPMAQPEFRVCAEMMKELYDKSDPTELRRGEWHLPYVPEDEAIHIRDDGFDPREVSVARCARTSYMAQSGQREFTEDVNLCRDRLLPSGHMSPFAHVCTPDRNNVRWVDIYDPDDAKLLGTRRLAKMGHYVGFQEYRHVVEGRLGLVSQR